jgi:hypothetical protein
VVRRRLIYNIADGIVSYTLVAAIVCGAVGFIGLIILGFVSLVEWLL